MITVEKLEKGTYFDDAFKISFRYDPTTVAKHSYSYYNKLKKRSVIKWVLLRVQ